MSGTGLPHCKAHATARRADSPSVILPAPVFMGLWLLLGLLLNRVLPAGIDPPPTVLHNSGLLLIGAGCLLDLWCFALFVAHRTHIMPNRGARELVVLGPYRFSRNPMYLGLALIHLGMMPATGVAWHAVTLLPHLLCIRYLVIAREEAHMRARFGQAYRDYCARVPRWF